MATGFKAKPNKDRLGPGSLPHYMNTGWKHAGGRLTSLQETSTEAVKNDGKECRRNRRKHEREIKKAMARKK